MAILRYAGRRSDFTPAPVWHYTTSTLKSPYAAVGFNSLSSDDVVKTVQIPGNPSDIWLQFYHWHGGFVGATTKLHFKNPQGNSLAWVYLNEGGSISLRLATASSSSQFSNITTVANTPSPFATTQILRKVDIHLKLHDTEGVFEIYVDNSLVAQYLGDTIRYTIGGSGAVFGSLTFEPNNTGAGYTGDVTSRHDILSGILVADEDTRGLIPLELDITGAGDTLEWTGDYMAIDDAATNNLATIKSEFIQVGAGNARANFALGDLPAEYATGYDVVALGVSGRASKGANRSLSLIAKHGGTEGLLALDVPNFESQFQGFFATNPSTSLPWTVAEVDAALIGVKT